MKRYITIGGKRIRIQLYLPTTHMYDDGSRTSAIISNKNADYLATWFMLMGAEMRPRGVQSHGVGMARTPEGYVLGEHVVMLNTSRFNWKITSHGLEALNLSTTQESKYERTRKCKNNR